MKIIVTKPLKISIKIDLLCLVSFCILSSAFAWSQPETPNADSSAAPQLEEIIVTAEIRESNLQRTPLSMLAATGRMLTSNNVFQVQDLMNVMPQLQVQPHPNASNTLSLYLRGVGNSDEQILQDPSVGVYINNVYIPRNMGLNLDLMDIERVEMLRGPQGTLYGRNATGGAINIITPHPGTELQGKIMQSAGSNSHRRGLVSLNLPLGNELAVRFEYGSLAQDGFVETSPNSSGSFGELDRESGRFDFRWLPVTSLDIRYTLDLHRADDVPGFIAAVPLYPERGNRPHSANVSFSELPRNKIDSMGHTLNVEWSANEDWEIKSISAYRALDDSQSQNYHQGLFGENALLLTSAMGEQSMRSQEFQISNANNDGRLKLLAGIYYFQEDASRNALNKIPSQKRAMLVFGKDIRNTSKAVYSRVSYTPELLSERLTLSAGIRLSSDKRRATLQRGMQNLASGITNLNPQLYIGNRDFSNASPELIAEFKIDDNRFVYIKSSRGYKSGGFNARASSVERFSQGFDDEHLLSTELGFKSEWFNRRLRLNAAVFYGDYQDIQLNVQSDPDNIVLSDVLNAGAASISGFEIDSSWVINSGLQIELNCTFLHTDISDVRNANNVNVARDYRLPGAPSRSCSSSLDMSRTLENGFNLFGNIAYRIQSDSFGSATTTAGEYRIPGYNMMNLRLGVELKVNRFSLQLASWVRNAGDKEYYLSHFNGGSGRVVPSAIFGPEETAGIDLTLQF